MQRHTPTDAEFVPSSARTLGPYLLGVALVANAATQLRFIPAVGPGELLLSGWLVLEALHLRDRPLRAPRSVVATWIALCAGMLVATLINLESASIAALGRAAANMLLVGACMTLVSSLPHPRQYLRRASVVASSGFIALNGLLYLLGGWTRTIGPVETYSAAGYGRFQGLADNPNTTAFYALGLCLFVVLVFDRAHDRWVRVLAAVPLALIGLATESDGFKLAVIVSTCALATLGLFSRKTRSGLGRLAARIMLLAVVIAMTPRIYEMATDMAHDTIEQQNQAEARVTLWSGCLRAAQSSPLVGKGPGAHGSDGSVGLAMECHNTYLELLASGGVVPLFCLVAALVTGLRASVRRGNVFAGSVLVATALAFMFAMYLRLPLYWMLLAIAADQPRADDDGGSEVAQPADDRERPLSGVGTDRGTATDDHPGPGGGAGAANRRRAFARHVAAPVHRPTAILRGHRP